MPEIIEILSAAEIAAQPLFRSDEEYLAFRDAFVDEVEPKQDEWLEARRLSEEEARQRLLR